MIITDIKVPVKVRRTLSSVGTSSSNIYFKLSTSKSTNVEDFVDAKCRCNLVNWESNNLVNWESIAGSPLQNIPNPNNLCNIIQL